MIVGDESNGLYTKINSYTDGLEISFNEILKNINIDNNNFILKMLICEIILLVIFSGIYYMIQKKQC